jgi:D-alanyl-D-alanine endopeptidase (penicillin-binding protein 7)
MLKKYHLLNSSLLRALVLSLGVSGLVLGVAEPAQAAKKATHLKKAKAKRGSSAAYAAPVSFGRSYGLHATRDALSLESSVALVVDQNTSEVLFSKNPSAVLPIASLTKLMTALVVVESRLPMDEILEVTDEDVDNEKHSRSRLSVGARLSREQMLHLALMSSENRAASSLGRHFPGGEQAFVAVMNRKAEQLGMHDTHYVEPTGLSSKNQSSAMDLARLVMAAYTQPLIREFSTSPADQITVGSRVIPYRNTNALVRNPAWEIGLQKTGYIAEAGRCMVMQTHLADRDVVMVFLDSQGKNSRIADAERVRRWMLHRAQTEQVPSEPRHMVAPVS